MTYAEVAVSLLRQATRPEYNTTIPDALAAAQVYAILDLAAAIRETNQREG